MAKDEPGYWPWTERLGELRPIVLTYRPRDKSLPPYVITGWPVQIRIKPEGESEIVINSGAGISITDGAAGEITIAIPILTKAAWTFTHADHVIMLNSQRLFYGTLQVESLYES